LHLWHPNLLCICMTTSAHTCCHPGQSGTLPMQRRNTGHDRTPGNRGGKRERAWCPWAAQSWWNSYKYTGMWREPTTRRTVNVTSSGTLKNSPTAVFLHLLALHEWILLAVLLRCALHRHQRDLVGEREPLLPLLELESHPGSKCVRHWNVSVGCNMRCR
jgi:hypothetical protein